MLEILLQSLAVYERLADWLADVKATVVKVFSFSGKTSRVEENFISLRRIILIIIGKARVENNKTLELPV